MDCNVFHGTTRYVSDFGATSCHECIPGNQLEFKEYVYETMYSVEVYSYLACVKCSNLSFSVRVDQQTCQTCPSGKFTMNAGESYCRDCDNGRFFRVFEKPGNNFELACIDCPRGRFTNSTSGKGNCISCPEGRFSGIKSSSCSSCTIGNYVDPDEHICKPCPLGKFMGQNQTSCSLCDPGKFTTSDGVSFCSNCPKFSSSVFGATDASKCICEKGYFGNSSHCEICPALDGFYCPGNSSIPLLVEGYARDPNNKLNAIACVPPSACLAQADGLETFCAEFYTGFLCGGCVPLKSYRSKNSCAPCPSPTAKYLTIAAILLILFAIFYKLSKTQNSVSPELRICFSALQLIALYPNVFSDWSSNLASFFNVISFSVRNLVLITF
jgi:hypothetical protein